MIVNRCELIADNKMWFIGYSENTVFLYDMIEEELECVCEIAEEEGVTRPFYTMVDTPSDLFLVPYNAASFYKISKKKHIYERLNIEGVCVTNKSFYPLFTTAFFFEGNIVMFGGRYPGILKYNIKNDKSYIINLENKIPFDFRTGNHSFFRSGVRKESNIILPSFSGPYYIKYNIITDNLQVEKIPVEINGFNCVCLDEDIMWLVSRENATLIKYNIKNNEILINKLESGKTDFRVDSINVNNEIINISLFQSSSLLKVNKYDLSQKLVTYSNTDSVKYVTSVENQEFILKTKGMSMELEEVGGKNKKIEVPDRIIEKLIHHSIRNKGVLREQIGLDIKALVSYLI